MKQENCTYRLETEADRSAVEHLIREAFWNVYRPGCLEHYVIHVLRDDPAFVPELNIVMEEDGEIIGQNLFVRSQIATDDGDSVQVLTMGPISIRPELQGQGYGRALLDYSLDQACQMGFGAVCIEGDIGFYGPSGFRPASELGIRYNDEPADADTPFFLCCELIPGYLSDVSGAYDTPQGYYVDENEAEEHVRAFPPMEKLRLPGQLF